VFRIAGGCGAGTIGAVGAALLYIFMPVVVNMSHEAKPHLPGAVLVLLAAMSAGKFVESGRSRWWVMTGILCGMSAAMVLTGATALLIPPIMVLLRPMALGRRGL
jgi:4-amino-4-deoxy-L-arabinose transferase-like glycosyltransferase